MLKLDSWLSELLFNYYNAPLHARELTPSHQLETRNHEASLTSTVTAIYFTFVPCNKDFQLIGPLPNVNT